MIGHFFINSVPLFELALLGISLFAGVLGAILGLGGGVIIVPVLTLLLGVHIRYAIGASIVSVIATSCGAAAIYVRDRITNIRVAMLLEIATTLGALSGAVLSTYIPSHYLYLIFAFMLLLSAWAMFFSKREHNTALSTDEKSLTARLKLNSSYHDFFLKQEVSYIVSRVPLGFILMAGAGIMSGLLGIGSGALKVPAMDTAMGLPIKVSSATSNFMIGVTAAASAGPYFMRGEILPLLAAPVILGVLMGSALGTHIMMRLTAKKVRWLFIAVLLVIAAQMALKAFGINVR